MQDRFRLVVAHPAGNYDESHLLNLRGSLVIDARLSNALSPQMMRSSRSLGPEINCFNSFSFGIDFTGRLWQGPRERPVVCQREGRASCTVTKTSQLNVHADISEVYS